MKKEMKLYTDYCCKLFFISRKRSLIVKFMKEIERQKEKIIKKFALNSNLKKVILLIKKNSQELIKERKRN